MTIQPGYYWHKGPKVYGGMIEPPDVWEQRGWTIVEVIDERVICQMGDDVHYSGYDAVATMEIGTFIPIPPPQE